MISAESMRIFCPFSIGPAEDLFDLFLRNNPLYTTPGLTNSALLPVYCLQSRIRNAVRIFGSFLLRLPAFASESGTQPLSTWAYSDT